MPFKFIWHVSRIPLTTPEFKVKTAEILHGNIVHYCNATSTYASFLFVKADYQLCCASEGKQLS